MFLFYLIHFLKFLVKSQPQRSYKKGSYIKKECILFLCFKRERLFKAGDCLRYIFTTFEGKLLLNSGVIIRVERFFEGLPLILLYF